MMKGDDIYFIDQNIANNVDRDIQPLDIKNKFKNFIKEMEIDGSLYYSKEIINNAELGNFFVKVNIGDIENYDMNLSSELRKKPLNYINIIEEAVKEHYLELNINKNELEVPSFQVQLVSNENIKKLRELKSELLNNLINVEGIILNSGRVIIKGNKIAIKCKSCHDKKYILLNKGFSGYSIPTYCGKTNNKCSREPYFIDGDDSEFTDFQVLKIQELPETLPTGEIPRTYQICVEKYLVDKLKPGTKVIITGVYTIKERNLIKNISNTFGIRLPYILVLGFQNKENSSFNMNFNKKDIEKFKEFASSPNVNEQITDSIAPLIFDHRNIKKAISSLLFSGSSKILPDKTKLRGDINILLLGDPSTAKSQFLKFVHKISPISVYTSGKGSSAAGLTAAIVRDSSTKEFQLEGGALVLADGGIVCIDEFDKMRVQDRVAIHEAMEQQTISIAKAGISTVLNSRTSILAAANPIFGSIVDKQSISDQIDLQTTILSRFDCIFLVKDIKNIENDKKMAMHIMELHTKEIDDKNTKGLNIEFLKNFIIYAKMNVHPRLNDEAALILQNFYVEDRQKAEEKKNKKNHIPITVRQLEAIIRLSESLAKMRLSDIVTKQDVIDAHELFNISTMNTISSGATGNVLNKNMITEIQNIEEYIKNKLKMGDKISYQRLIEDIQSLFKNLQNINQAVDNLIKLEILDHWQKNNIITRKK